MRSFNTHVYSEFVQKLVSQLLGLTHMTDPTNADLNAPDSDDSNAEQTADGQINDNVTEDNNATEVESGILDAEATAAQTANESQTKDEEETHAAEPVDLTATDSQQTQSESSVDGTLDEQWQNSIRSEHVPGSTLKQNCGASTVGKLSVTLKQREFSRDGSSPSRDDDAPDYNIERLLGEGGIGAVYSARQLSMGRSVAVKVLKSTSSQSSNSQQVFVSEAIITGGLDHPNIIPIYDVGHQSDNSPFYAMKQVQGVEWAARIETNELEENLNILLRVADALAFAHSRHIIHRDLKPANVMLGDFGEVLLMDWGLAVPTISHPHQSEFPPTGGGGTPCYMAPEMAAGPVSRVDERSDIYLLGAVLFRVITGHTPHTAKTVRECLRDAALNVIADSPVADSPDEKADSSDETADASKGNTARAEIPAELKGIALTAMSTDRDDRFQTVQEFQQAVRVFISHSESLALQERADKDLNEARQSHDYQDFAKALFGFRDAGDLWDGNDAAQDGISQSSFAYASTAADNGDFDLATTLLDRKIPEHETLHAQIQTKRAERDDRLRRLQRAKFVGVSGAVILLIVISGAALWINAARQLAISESIAARRARGLAEVAKGEAEQQRKRAENNLDLAERNLVAAEVARKAAEEAKKIATAAEAIAKKETITAKAVSGFLVGMFEGSDPIGLNGFRFGVIDKSRADLTAKEILEQGAKTIVDELIDEPAARATLMNTIGNSFRSIAAFEEAKPLIEEALKLRRELYQGDHVEIAESLHTMGWLVQDAGDYVEAIKIYREALAMRERLAGKNSALATQTMFQLGWVLALASQFDEAEKIMIQTIVNRKKIFGKDHRLVAFALSAYAALQLTRGDNDMKIILTVQQALTILLKQEGSENVGAVAMACQKAMVQHRFMGNLQMAKPNYEKAIQGGSDLLGENHPYVLAMQHEYANLLSDLGDDIEAERLLKHILEIGQSFADLSHPKLVIASSSLARVLERNKKYEEAKVIYLRQLPIRTKTHENEVKNEGAQNRLWNTHYRLGSVYFALSEWKNSRLHYKRAFELESPSNDKIEQKMDLASQTLKLAHISRHLGEFEESRALYVKAHNLRKEVLASKPGSLKSQSSASYTLFKKGQMEIAAGDYEQAIEHFQQVLSEIEPFEGEKQFKEKDYYARNLDLYRRQLKTSQREWKAITDLDHVLKQDPDETWSLLLIRARVFARRGTIDESLEEIDRLKERVGEEKKATRQISLARCYALCANNVLPKGAAPDSATKEQAERIEQLKKLAVDSLDQAILAGWKLKAITKYPEFQSLSDRDDFKESVSKLVDKPAAPTRRSQTQRSQSDEARCNKADRGLAMSRPNHQY
jgi:serine/threonine protein kinase